MRINLKNQPFNAYAPLHCETQGLEFSATIITYVCPRCGTEAFGGAMDVFDLLTYFSLKRDLGLSSEEICDRHQAVQVVSDEFFNRLDILRGEQQCPCCGEALSHEAGYWTQTTERCPSTYLALDDALLDPIFEEMESVRMAQIRSRAANLVSTYDKKHKIADSMDGNGAEIASSPKTLSPYVGHLMHLEMGIYATEQHLAELYEGKARLKCECLGSVAEAIAQNSSKVEDAEMDLEDLLSQLDDFSVKLSSEEIDQISMQQPRCEYARKPQAPQRPVFKEAKPQEPVYEKPGLFNKKKVLEENAAKKARYDRDLEQYNQKHDAYQAAMEVYLQAEEQYRSALNAWKADCKEKDAAATAKYEEAINQALEQKEAEARAELENKIAAARQEFEAAKAAVVPFKDNAEEFAGMVLLSKEIADGEKLLDEQIEARNKLYSLNVIYPKYRNLVAVASIYDYLISGRCSALAGSDGAYNLFESESRADLIITKLSDVLTSLDRIQENQYLLYQQMSEINDGVRTLNSSMKTVISSLAKLDEKAEDMVAHLTSIDHKATDIGNTLDAIGSSVSTIAEHTDVIAHNSAITAFYAKRNAELTNALGYLVAFK